MRIVPYEERYREDFISFNTDWITTYFERLEEPDIRMFEQIDAFLAQGGMIFVAVDDEERALAVCMAHPMDEPDTWEISKLGSSRELPHRGAGKALVKRCQQWAADHGAQRIVIITNTALKAAIHVYMSCGFRELPLEDYGYARGDIAFEWFPHNAAE